MVTTSCSCTDCSRLTWLFRVQHFIAVVQSAVRPKIQHICCVQKQQIVRLLSNTLTYVAYLRRPVRYGTRSGTNMGSNIVALTTSKAALLQLPGHVLISAVTADLPCPAVIWRARPLSWVSQQHAASTPGSPDCRWRIVPSRPRVT